MQYKDKLNDPRWKTFAKSVYARDDFSCINKCGWNKDYNIPLVAHHRVYYTTNGSLADPWNYPLRDMETLCKTCHDIFHILLGFSVPIIDRKTRKIMNECIKTKETRIKIQKQLRKDRKNA